MNCPHCGHETHSGRTYCPNCGERIIPLDELRRQEEQRRHAVRRLAVLIALCVLAVSAGVFLIGKYAPKKPSRPTEVASESTAPTTAPTRSTNPPSVTEPPQTASVISSVEEFHRAIRAAIVAGEDHIDNIRLTRNQIQDALMDYGYYYTDPSSTIESKPGLIDLNLTLTPSRRAFNAYRSGNRAGLDPEASDLLRQAEAVVNRLITPGMSDVDKELALHDYIINNCDYLIDVEGRHTGDARGFFQYHKLQCTGYSDTFWLLGSMAGLEIAIISGMSTKDLDPAMAAQYNVPDNGHAWNLIRLNGLWYGLDLTWDDPVGAQILQYDYFNIPTNYFSQDRKWNAYQNPDGAYAQSIDGNYRYLQIYDRPEYRANTVDEAVQSCIRQIGQSGEAYICLTDKVNSKSKAEQISEGIATHYQRNSYKLPVIDDQSIVAADMPFYIYKYSLSS